MFYAETHMNRLLSLLGLSVLLLNVVPSIVHADACYVDPVTQYAGKGTVKSAVFMRDQACVTGSSILVTLSAGASVDVIGFTDGWYRVETSSGARGWVGQQFITTSAQQTGMTWSSYQTYMTEVPSKSSSSATPAAPSTQNETLYQGTISTRDLVKAACASGAKVDDPCKAVYYIGADGKRHAYPNSRVYFSWYQDFNAVRVVSASTLSSYPLGANVTYRPGERMVKFTTDPKVYAVSDGGVLRWVKTEELATSLYGSAWNTKIDDISDAFYTNYVFGAEVVSSTDFSPSKEMEGSATFD